MILNNPTCSYIILHDPAWSCMVLYDPAIPYVPLKAKNSNRILIGNLKMEKRAKPIVANPTQDKPQKWRSPYFDDRCKD